MVRSRRPHASRSNFSAVVSIILIRARYSILLVTGGFEKKGSDPANCGFQLQCTQVQGACPLFLRKAGTGPRNVPMLMLTTGTYFRNGLTAITVTMTRLAPAFLRARAAALAIEPVV